MQSLWLPAINAQLALNRKNPAAAIDASAERLPPIEYGQIAFLTKFPACIPPTFAARRIWRRDRARPRRPSSRRSSITAASSGTAGRERWRGWAWLAQMLCRRRTRQGADADAARVRALAAYKDFLTLWKDADPDIPIYKQAKAEYAKLQ